MFSPKGITESTVDSYDIDVLIDWIEEADRIVVGAGSGLSASAGFVYEGKRFDDNFADFKESYGMTDMYSGGFTRFRSLEEKWGFWSRMIMLNRYYSEDNGTYEALKNILNGRDYYVVTSNVDHCFQRFGFDKNRLFYMQGDYGLWQCSEPCHNKTYDNEAIVRRMYSEQEWMKVPKELIPYCPICGRPMEMNLRCDDRFIQDEGWYESARRFEAYMQECYHEDTLFLELGVGFNTPSLIKYPFWKDAAMNQRHRYICINTDFPVYPKELTGRALAIKADIGTVLKDILDQSEAESGV